jgi:hypothetical protein
MVKQDTVNLEQRPPKMKEEMRELRILKAAMVDQQ